MRSKRAWRARVWSLLAASVSVLYVGVPCTERIRTSVVVGSRSFLAQLLDPSTLILPAIDAQAGR